jgi:type I restriction enzyme S subunit
MPKLIETNIPWIGKIPSEWAIGPLFSVANENKEKNLNKNENVLSLSYGKIIRRDLSKNYGLLPENFDSYQVVNRGYIIIRSTDLQNDKKSLRVGLVPEVGIITSAYIGLSPLNNIHPEYLFYYLNMCDHKKVFYSLGGGLRQSLRFEEFRRFPVILPKLEEQRVISIYLNKKINQADSLIEKIQQRKIVIKDAIRAHLFEVKLKKTKLKQYPNEWFQSLPENWEIVKFRYLFEPIKVTNNSPRERLLSVTQDRGVVFRDEQDREVVNPGDDTSSYKLVEPGNIIISLRSADGGLETSDVRGLVSPAYIVLRPKFKIDRNFYRYLLTSKNFIVEMSRYIKGIRDGKNIYFDDIKDVLIPYLPQEKWDKAQDEVSIIHQNLVNSFEKFDLKIQFLEEYKRSIISSAVSGHIRVTESMI